MLRGTVSLYRDFSLVVMVAVSLDALLPVQLSVGFLIRITTQARFVT